MKIDLSPHLSRSFVFCNNDLCKSVTDDIYKIFWTSDSIKNMVHYSSNARKNMVVYDAKGSTIGFYLSIRHRQHLNPCHIKKKCVTGHLTPSDTITQTT